MAIAKLTPVTKTYVHCPNCDHQMSVVDHLFKDKIKSAGPWSCRKCNLEWLLSLNEDQLTIIQYEGQSKPFAPALALLRTRTSPAIYFIVPVRSMDPDNVGENRYFYDEHTCPTNWINDSTIVVRNGQPILSPFRNVCIDVSNGVEDNHEMYAIVDIRSAKPLYEACGLSYDFSEPDHGVDWCEFHNNGLAEQIFPQAFEISIGVVLDGEANSVANMLALTQPSLQIKG